MTLRGVSLVAALALLAAGCDTDADQRRDRAERPTAETREGPQFPVAYRVSRGDALKLTGTDAGALLERRGEVVAETSWTPSYGAVLALELSQRHGVDLLRNEPRYDRIVGELSAEQDLPVMMLTDRHRRRYARRLQRAQPSPARLRRVYEGFHEEDAPEAGRAMRSWLEVFRTALREARGAAVVVVPLNE